jgi:hypothetical protein
MNPTKSCENKSLLNMDSAQKIQKEYLESTIAKYRAIIEEQGMVWTQMSEEKITKELIDFEMAKMNLYNSRERRLREYVEQVNEVAHQEAHQETPTALTDNYIAPPIYDICDDTDEQENNNLYQSEDKMFDVYDIPSRQAYLHIGYITNQFSIIDPAYATQLLHNIELQPFITYGQMSIYINHIRPTKDIIKQIIGKNGCYLKTTTSNTGVDFIWYDRAIDTFLFWGKRPNVFNAMKIIRSRINKYTKNTF